MAVLGGVWDWMQENSSGLSIVLSLAGFMILIVQAGRTRRAAEAASTAAKESKKALLHASTVADLAAARGVIGATQDALRGERWETALMHAQAVRDRLVQIRSRSELSSEQKQAQIQEMTTFLVKLHESLERKLVSGNVQLDVAKACTRLSGFGTTIAAWTEEVGTQIGGVTDGK